jgi:hypothetical protein
LVSYSDDRSKSLRQFGARFSRPISRPTSQLFSRANFDFAINLKTAKALGLTIPEALLATA